MPRQAWAAGRCRSFASGAVVASFPRSADQFPEQRDSGIATPLMLLGVEILNRAKSSCRGASCLDDRRLPCGRRWIGWSCVQHTDRQHHCACPSAQRRRPKKAGEDQAIGRLRGELTMALVIPWLLEREYQQHRNLDYYGLPETFEEWREIANALADQLSRVTGRRVVKVVLHPGELEEWARRKGQAVSTKVRSDFAETLWRTESAGITP
jgi:hypothetical protein